MTLLMERTEARADEALALDEAVIEAFAANIRGGVVRPGDDGYDAARRVWNGMIDKRPGLIARCLGTADVVAAVNFGREHGLRVAVRGNGHNVAGNALNDGGLVIDLSAMKGIHVDPLKRSARVQPGANWGDIDRETQLHGLVTPGGEVSVTGVAGFTLSGGMGMLRRKWGLACDNLLSVELVTADGEVRRASPTEHPDLFWAVRGGGGNVGVVTWFEFQLYPLGPEVFLAEPVYDAGETPALLRAWRDYAEQTPDEVTSEALLWGMPPLPFLPAEMHGAPVTIFAGLYAGPVDAGERAMRPLRELATPLVDLSVAMTYVEVQKAPDPLFPDGRHNYWKSLFVDELDDDLIDTVAALHRDRPTPQTLIVIRHLGGAVSRVPDDATAYANRRAPYNISLDVTWTDPADNERMIAWVRQAWQGLRDRTGGGVYLNFAGLGEENEALARAGYGGNVERLREIKRRYDPGNLFRGNINVAP